MRPPQIDDQAALERALEADVFLLFKHSQTCPVSTRAFEEYEAFAAERADLPTGWIDVVAQRHWSLWVAERTGVAHQSPQALLVSGGAVVWSASHFDITRKGLAEALDA